MHNAYPLDLEYFGSSSLNGSYPVGSRFRFICDNGKQFDEAVRLYECENGTFFATTNGEPLWMGELEQHFSELSLPYDLDSIASYIKDNKI